MSLPPAEDDMSKRTAARPRLELTLVEVPRGAVVQARGELGTAEADLLALHLRRLAALRAPRVVFDLSGVTFVSSLALGLLVRFWHGQTRCGRAVALAALPPGVAEAVRVTGLDELFPVFAGVDDALAAA
jgi:anti-anti-sigma factor